MSADPKKVSAIATAEPPTNASEVRSFLGMTNYLSRFIPDYADLTAPLRELTKKDTPWTWTTTHQAAFERLQESLTTADTMSYFDPKKDTYLVVDASPCGLGAILCQSSPTNPQDVKVVAYGSRALTDVERRYSQTEREALAIVWACEHFHLFIQGNKVTVITDHKPVQLLWSNPSSKPPARIERWGLRLQPYDLDIVYRPGKTNPADYMSRHPPQAVDRRESRLSRRTEEYINYVTSSSLPKAMTLQEVKDHTARDPVLQEVIRKMHGHWPKLKDEQPAQAPFNAIKDELTITEHDELVLRGNRLVIPESLRQKIVILAHQGHQGLVKTKKLIREKVWFPGIDRLVEDAVRSCTACQANTPLTQNQAPLNMTPLPDGPWEHLSADFSGPYPTGEYLLVVVDDYSRFPVVHTTKSTSARSIIPILDQIFSTFGIPKILKTDNGPPFNGHDFKQFSTYLGFHHQKITPHWPQANGEAERFMRTINKVVRAAAVDQIPLKQAMNRFCATTAQLLTPQQKNPSGTALWKETSDAAAQHDNTSQQ